MAFLPFRSTYRVTYADCTVGNHVYHSRYLDILDFVRGEFFRNLGMPLIICQDRAIIFPIVESHVRYLLPARYDDLLTIDVWASELRGARITFQYLVTREQDLRLLEATTWHACTNLEDRPRRLPPDLVGLMQPYFRNDDGVEAHARPN